MKSPALSSEHRYLQIARALRKEIVDGVYPVGSRLPTEHQLCERFAVSRYTVREALRRLREDNLVTSRPRAGTRVVSGPTSRSYVHEALSIDDLLAFAAGARLTIESNELVTLDGELAVRTGLRAGTQWLSVRGYRQADGASEPLCRTEYYINRRFAAVGRLLERHAGPIFPLIEDLFGVSIAELQQEITAVLEHGSPALQMQRTYTTSDGDIAQVTVNTHLSAGFRYAMTLRRAGD